MIVDAMKLVKGAMSSIHLHEELAQTKDRVIVETRFGPVTGGRSKNGAVVFLGQSTKSQLYATETI